VDLCNSFSWRSKASPNFHDREWAREPVSEDARNTFVWESKVLAEPEMQGEGDGRLFRHEKGGLLEGPLFHRSAKCPQHGVCLKI
jgi:hypothetical protein